MARFLQDSDYDSLIRQEIKRILDGSAPGEAKPPTKLLRAESSAVSQMKNYLAGRFDMDAIFVAPADPDTRDQFIVTITIDITLYLLYSQTGWKDIPKHRSERYQDALDWLRDAGRGDINTDLPSSLSDENPGEVRIFSRPPENQRW